MSKLLGSFAPLIIFLLSLFSVPPSATARQELYLYDGFNQTGESRFYMWTRKNEADLIDYPSLNLNDGQPHRICYIGGLTIYTGPNFSGVGSYLNYTSRMICEFLQPDQGYVSFQFPGLIDDAYASTLSLYSQPQFLGDVTLVVTADSSVINDSFSSVYKTGDEAWSLYLGYNYTGFRICLQESVIQDVNELGIPPGAIKSARIGCI